MPRRILPIASVLLGVVLTIHAFVGLHNAQTTTAASRLGLELSLGSMMVILGAVYLKRKGPN
jgi:drug/metabolite transporter (DMT)-like permease